jgi:hypothetical protein
MTTRAAAVGQSTIKVKNRKHPAMTRVMETFG